MIHTTVLAKFLAQPKGGQTRVVGPHAVLGALQAVFPFRECFPCGPGWVVAHREEVLGAHDPTLRVMRLPTTLRGLLEGEIDPATDDARLVTLEGPDGSALPWVGPVDGSSPHRDGVAARAEGPATVVAVPETETFVKLHITARKVHPYACRERQQQRNQQPQR